MNPTAALLICFGGAVIGMALIGAVAACMVSSRSSREEERRDAALWSACDPDGWPAEVEQQGGQPVDFEQTLILMGSEGEQPARSGKAAKEAAS